MIDKKMVIYKIFILLIAFVSIFLLYTSNIYIYKEISIKLFSKSMIVGIILWILFLINALILTFKMNNMGKKYIRLKNILRNIVLLNFITLLLVYKIGNGILKLYKMNKSTFNSIIYIIFGFIFIIYFILIFWLNKKECLSIKKK